ncbi:MAG: sodium:solute symporter family transporter, partial [Planctomycetota bacterium]
MSDRYGRWSVWAIVLLIAVGWLTPEARAVGHALTWSELPPLPDTIGYGGPFVGRHNGALIVAGGANFSQAPPWQGGAKVWTDQIYVLTDAAGEWDTRFRLPHKLAYGGAVSTPEGLLLIGGSDESEVFGTVYRLKWNAEAEDLIIETLPSLPRPSAYLAAELVGTRVYAIAGKTEKSDDTAIRAMWMLDLAAPESEHAWNELEPMPGPARQKVVTAVQTHKGYPKLFAFSGQETTRGADDVLVYRNLTDAYRYDPAEDAWTRLAELPALPEPRDVPGKVRFEGQPTPIAAGVGIRAGQSHVLLFSGSTGRYVPLPLEDRPLFPARVLAYHVITDTYVEAGAMPRGVVTTGATEWGGRVVIASGEIRPGVRTPKVMAVEVDPPGVGFGTINYVVLGMYLAALVGLGVYCSRRESSTGQFFLAGKRIPWWAAGISIYATQLSAITFVGTPAVAYAEDWAVYPSKFTILLMAPFVIYLFLPFYRRLNVTTAYEYLERRFNVAVRLYGSLSFIAFQLGRMAIVMY